MKHVLLIWDKMQFLRKNNLHLKISASTVLKLFINGKAKMFVSTNVSKQIVTVGRQNFFH